jgi:CxxC-x17-CxxC domain-containing protein
MKKNPKSKSKAAPAVKVDPYLEGFMSKLVERLTGLEHKIDSLIASHPSHQPQAPHVQQNRPFQPPPSKEPARKERTLYEAICADCKKVCEVPFKPAEGRAVYCKDCFSARKAGGPGNFNGPKPQDVPQKSAAPPQAAPQPPAAVSKKSKPAKKTKKKK